MAEIFSFGVWLKQRRSALLLSRDDLARKVGCAEVTLRKIEADERRPSLAVAERLADRLELAGDERALFLQVARGLVGANRLPPPIPRGAVVPAPSAPRSRLPSGTVTFLFTDIAGSTQLWEQQPDAMREALARHDAILRRAIQTHQGVVVKSTGDGVHAVFARAPDALTAALAAQRALQAADWDATGSLRVRMALHTGVTEERDGDYFGPPLNRVARLLAAGHGGQTLLSLAAAELVREHLPPDAELRDLGTHRLKDLSHPEQIFQLVAPDLSADFPPLHTLDARRSNLPAQPTALIGREQEIATICDLLRQPDVRLMTLTGPGGIGKTRLGLQVAAELLDTFADGVFFVNLAPIHDPNLVASAVAQTLGLTKTGDQPLQERLQYYLRNKQLLLLLDNFEQVLDAAPLVAELLAACPHVNILVTSRVPLHLRGEKEFAVSPLALPDIQRLPALGQLTQYTAVELFIERALDVQPNFAVTNDNAPAVAEICARLDGLPLAIELAAARLKLFTPEALLARLSNRLALLTGGARDLPVRQQTLRSTIAWSYDLLDQSAQTLFARLAVFVGGCTPDAAAAVCKGISDRTLDVLDGLALLADNSLLRRVDGADGEPRFVMLETIREYALEQLEASDEAEQVRRRHAAHFLALAEEARPWIGRREQGVWLDRLDLEHDNLRAALGWALGGGAAEVGARMALALAGHDRSSFWDLRGHDSEGLRWLERVVEQPNQLTPAQRAWALLRADFFRSGLNGISWDQSFAVEDQALALFREVGDRAGIASVIAGRGGNAWFRGDYAQATHLLEEALAFYQQIDQHDGIARTLHQMGNVARDSGDAARASQLLGESLAVCQSEGYVERATLVLCGMGDVPCIQGDLPRATALYWESFLSFQDEQHFSATKTYPLRNLGFMVLLQGDDGRMLALLQQAVAWWREKGNQVSLGLLTDILGAVLYSAGQAEAGLAILHEGLTLQMQLGQTYIVIEIIELLAGIALGQGQTVQAVRLLAAATTLRRVLGLPGYPAARCYSNHTLAATRAQLGADAFDAAWAAGQALTLEQAIAEALNR